MKKYWNYYQCTRFDNVNTSGIGKWILAAIILNVIVMRMCMTVEGDSTSTDMDFFAIIICLGAFFSMEQYLRGKQIFSKSLPFTSREQVNMVFIMYVGVFLGLGCIMLLMAVIFLVLNPSEWDGFLKQNIPIESRLEALFIFFYYLLLSALVLPLGMIKSKKKWYLGFFGVACIVEMINLVLINLLPESKAGFKTYGMVFENITTIPNFHSILVAMGIVSVSMAVGSYFLIQKLHAPKKY